MALFVCAGRENRTPVYCLEGSHSTTKLYPHLTLANISKKTFYRNENWYNTKMSGSLLKIFLIPLFITFIYFSYKSEVKSPVLEIEEETREETTIEQIEMTIETEDSQVEQKPEESIQKQETQKDLVQTNQTETTPQTQVVIQNTPNTQGGKDFVILNEESRKSIVNILCQINGDNLSTITGSGVIIDPRGIILTNAHIAQYMLLQNYKFKNFVDCTIRTGEPAYPRYKAELIYISPDWVKENKSILTEENPKGTGENDFAFLRITESIDKTPLPAFNFIRPDVREEIEIGEPVLLASYPAGFLGSISVLQGLYINSAITTVQKVFTFTDTTLDLISVGGTVLSQKGSSGGAVVDRYGRIIGLISTSSEADTTSERDLRAITMAHINRRMIDPFGGLNSFLSLNMENTADIFQSTLLPSLSELIITELEK